MTGPIDFADITVGMQVTATTTWTATGASSSTSATVLAVDGNGVTLSNGDTVPAPIWVDPTTTVTYTLDSAAPTPPPSAPALGTICADETGAAWQATGSHDAVVMYGINGDQLSWDDFYTAHPAYTTMQDTQIVPLPAPVTPYPLVITPGDARLGMDIRVTVDYDTGGQRVTRNVCQWVQDDPPPDDEIPSFFCLPEVAGTQGVGDTQWVELAATNPVFQDLVHGRYVIQYDPLPADVTITVEQMQTWTADTVWDVNVPEPPIGAVVRSRYGVAWQRTADATEDGPEHDGGIWYLSGQGMWSSVTGDYPRSFLWLWGAAAPFNVQEATP